MTEDEIKKLREGDEALQETVMNLLVSLHGAEVIIGKKDEEIAELKRLINNIHCLTRNFGPPAEEEKA